MTSSPNRVLGVALGIAYLLLGALGFTATPAVGFFAANGGLLLGILQVNPLHNVVHLVLGAALLAAALAGARAAATANAVLGAACLALGLAGLFLVGSAANILAINVADNVLHFGTAAVLLAAGLGADRRPARVAPS